MVGKMLDNPGIYPADLQAAIKKFPYQADEAGVCSQLDEAGKCKVYKERPLICDVDKLFTKIYKKTDTRRQYYKKNAVSCNKIITMLNLDDKFKINEKTI